MRIPNDRAAASHVYYVNHALVGAVCRYASPMADDEQSVLFAELYADLRRIAGRELRRGGNGLRISATTLLHETYMSFSQREA
jgi:hypothetical protein